MQVTDYQLIQNDGIKKILIVIGHPNKESFSLGLAGTYKKGASDAGVEVQEIIIRDLLFNPNLQFGYQKRTETEEDLTDSWGKN